MNLPKEKTYFLNFLEIPKKRMESVQKVVSVFSKLLKRVEGTIPTASHETEIS